MKKCLSIVILLASTCFCLAQNAPVYFANYPTLTPDGRTIIFSYEGDLWKVDTKGGTANRITAMEGIETRPKVSPDGQWLAFSSNQYGNADIFIMPLQGGAIRQLSFHEAADQMSSWSWDSQSLYFTPDRYNRVSSYQINRVGGTPIRVFGHYFNNIHNFIEHPSSGEVFFNETWESERFAQDTKSWASSTLAEDEL